MGEGLRILAIWCRAREDSSWVLRTEPLTIPNLFKQYIYIPLDLDQDSFHWAWPIFNEEIAENQFQNVLSLGQVGVSMYPLDRRTCSRHFKSCTWWMGYEVKRIGCINIKYWLIEETTWIKLWKDVLRVTSEQWYGRVDTALHWSTWTSCKQSQFQTLRVFPDIQMNWTVRMSAKSSGKRKTKRRIFYWLF